MPGSLRLLPFCCPEAHPPDFASLAFSITLRADRNGEAPTMAQTDDQVSPYLLRPLRRLEDVVAARMAKGKPPAASGRLREPSLSETAAKERAT